MQDPGLNGVKQVSFLWDFSEPVLTGFVTAQDRLVGCRVPSVCPRDPVITGLSVGWWSVDPVGTLPVFGQVGLCGSQSLPRFSGLYILGSATSPT